VSGTSSDPNKSVAFAGMSETGTMGQSGDQGIINSQGSQGSTSDGISGDSSGQQSNTGDGPTTYLN